MTTYATRYKTGNLNSTIALDFNGANVTSYVVGLSYWKLGIKSGNWLADVRLKVSSSLKNGVVEARVTADMDGKTLTAESTVTVSCLAVIDGPDGRSTLAQVDNIANGASSSVISLCSSQGGIAQPVLSGFDVSFPGHASHQIQEIHMGLDFKQSGAAGELKGRVGLSGHQDPYPFTVNGGLVYLDERAGVTLDPVAGSPLLKAGTVTAQTWTGRASAGPTFNMGLPLKDAVVFIQSMTVSYASQSQNVRLIGGGAPGWVLGAGAASPLVKLLSAEAFMANGDGVFEADSSSVTLLVVGIPA